MIIPEITPQQMQRFQAALKQSGLQGELKAFNASSQTLLVVSLILDDTQQAKNLIKLMHNASA